MIANIKARTYALAIIGFIFISCSATPSKSGQSAFADQVSTEIVGKSLRVTLTFNRVNIDIVDVAMATEARKISLSDGLSGKTDLWFFIRDANDKLYWKARYSSASITGIDWNKKFPGNFHFFDMADEWQVRPAGHLFMDRYCPNNPSSDIPRLCAFRGY